jgi:hypothetical protein
MVQVRTGPSRIKSLDKKSIRNKMPAHKGDSTMALLSSIISARELASLSEHQLDVLVSALDAEILSNAAVKKAVAARIQSVHKSLAAETPTAKPGGTKGGTKA